MESFFWSCAHLRMMMMSHLITTVSVNALFWFKELSFKHSGSWVWICSKHTLVEKTEIKLTLMTPGFMAHAHSAGVVPLFPLVAEGCKYPTQCPSLICSSITFSHVGSSFCCLACLQLYFPSSAKSAFELLCRSGCMQNTAFMACCWDLKCMQLLLWGII